MGNDKPPAGQLCPPQPPFNLADLARIMRDLRDRENGCEWDRAQDFASIAPYTIEEAYEVADAIARNDMAALRDELGDLLLQTVYHAQMAAEASVFTLDDVVAGICEKMIRRHPHVYDGACPRDGVEQVRAWETQKAAERAASGEAGALAGVAMGLPALLRAEKLQKRAARVGFDWPDASGPRAKIDEELAEVAAADDVQKADEIGDLLFSVVNWARHLGIDAEAALRGANGRFVARFTHMENSAVGALDTYSSEELEAFWVAAKAAQSTAYG